MSTFSNLRTRPSSASAVPLTQQQEPPRITPRNSDMEKQMAAGTTKETPYHTLRQLSNVIPRPTTPERRASSVGPPSTHASGRRTPAAQTRTPGAVQRLAGSARRVRPVTPHGRAAIRDIEARRAGLTPGKDRRRSGRQQRETPRDILRALSRTLAPTTQPIISSPQEFASTRRFTLPVRDDLDDGPELERPRLSLPFGDDDNEDDDDDDSLLLPPQTAGLEDENFTVRSVELPRRALSEQPGRLSRGSFGSIRLSDRFVDLNEIGSGGLDYDGVDSSYNLPGTFQADDIPDMGDTLGLQGENSGILRGFATDTSRISLASGRQSDIRPAVLTGDDTDTFAFTIPQQDPNGASLVFQEEESERHLDYNEAASENDDTTPELQAYSDSADVDVSMLDTSLQELDGIGQAGHKTARKKKIKISKHGIQYPSLPAAVVKKLATTFARTGGNSKAKLGKDALDAIQQASDWFFEQVSDDLGAYAKHAGRKTIDENDVIMLMTRQRQTNATTTPFSLAQKHLPRELLQELRMIPPPKSHRGRRLEVVEETNE